MSNTYNTALQVLTHRPQHSQALPGQQEVVGKSLLALVMRVEGGPKLLLGSKAVESLHPSVLLVDIGGLLRLGRSDDVDLGGMFDEVGHFGVHDCGVHCCCCLLGAEDTALLPNYGVYFVEDALAYWIWRLLVGELSYSFCCVADILDQIGLFFIVFYPFLSADGPHCCISIDILL